MVLLSDIIVISTIYLNNQFGWQTSEICNIIADDVLSSKRLTHLVLLQIYP